MASQIYTDIGIEGISNIPQVNNARIKIINNNDGTYTAHGDQDQIDIINNLGTWTQQ